MIRLATILLAVAGAAGATPAQVETGTGERPKIGLVLSGGGARGAAHIGVLRVLEELRIPIDYLAGNSMGALVGGIYAYGYAPDEMQALIESLNWNALLSDRAPRAGRSFRRKQDDRNFLAKFRLGFSDFRFKLPKGLVQGHEIGNLLRFVLPEAYRTNEFGELPVPFRAVATEITTGEQVVLERGSLPVALSASMAIPGVFAPVVIDGRELVDGLVVNNVPIDVARDMGAEVLIVIDIGSPLLDAEQISSLLGVTQQMLAILTQKNVDESLATLTERDLLVRPDLGNITSSDFKRAPEAIEIGERAARALEAELRRFSVSEEEYARFLSHQRRQPAPPPTVDEVRIVNNSGLSDRVIRARLRTAAGEPFDPDVLQRDIDRLYGLEEFERVTFQLHETEDGRTRLDVIADEKSWGPNYLRFGLNLVSDFDRNAYWNVGANYTLQSLNRLGGELRNQVQLGRNLLLGSEFFQPVEPSQTVFIAALVRYEDRPLGIYQNGRLLGELDAKGWQVGGDAGLHVGNWGELRLGVRYGSGDGDFVLTPDGPQAVDIDDGVVRAAFVIDTLDDVNFPTRGTEGGVEWIGSSGALGSDLDYQRLEVGLAHAVPFGRTTIAASASFGTTLEGDLPLYRQHLLGGFLRLSGLRTNELAGQHTALFRLFAFHRISGSPTELLGLPLYAGASLETGNVWDDRDDVMRDLLLAGSVYLGTDTPLGPLYFGYGYAEGGRDSLYLFLGRTFR